MNDDLDLLSLQGPVGKGQENNPDDIEALDGALRIIRAYEPPPEYADYPQRYATEPMIGALERLQEQNRLKVDGVANPGGPTERAINNRLLRKPSGAGLLYDPPALINGTVGNGFENRPADVASVKRRLAALDYLPEDPFDRPSGFIDEGSTNGIKEFQRAKGLADDGWLAPRGETERALVDAVADLARVKGREWFAFIERAGRAQRSPESKFSKSPDRVSSPDSGEDEEGIVPARVASSIIPRPAPTIPGRPGQPLQPPIPLDRPGLVGVDPRHLPPPRPPLRWSDPLPRDLRFMNPGERPYDPQFRSPRTTTPRGVGMPDDEAPSIDDIPRALGRRPEPSLDDEVKRVLPIVPRRIEPEVYVPEPGSPLRIPILDVHRDGRPGKPETVQTTEDAVDAIEKECKKVLEKTGATFERNMEEYYRPIDGAPGQRRGASYADGLVRIKIGDITIDFVADTYTPKVDAMPNAAEDARFMKLERNVRRNHSIVIRVPKAWALDQEINKEKLSEATRKICEQIKNLLDEGELEQGKERIFIKRLLDELVKPKPKSGLRPSDDPEQSP
ncbi:MAG TPA: peptidoglycan-binding domain-containing protein [Alphaproteobacteria bacterium]|jgi:hypothetical protein